LALLLFLTLAAASCGNDDEDSGECDPLEEATPPHPDSQVIWLLCPVGTCFDGAACVGEVETLVWQDALDGCPAGFRLPTQWEYQDLLDCYQEEVLICDPCSGSNYCRNMIVFDGKYLNESDQYQSYYSSNEVSGASDQVYTAQLELGEISTSEKDVLRPIRCVRFEWESASASWEFP
jgi:hypothetical protein